MEENIFNDKKTINHEGLKILAKIIAKRIIKEVGRNNENLTINSTMSRLYGLNIADKGKNKSDRL